MNNRIKSIRTTMNMSQQQFAERIGITRSAVANIESGKKSPSELAINAICYVFNVNKKWLYTGEGKMFNNTPNIKETEAFRKKLLSFISNLSVSQLTALAEIAEDFCDDSEN